MKKTVDTIPKIGVIGRIEILVRRQEKSIFSVENAALDTLRGKVSLQLIQILYDGIVV